MTMIADPPPSRRSPPVTASIHTSPTDRLRTSFAAARVSFTWFGVRKSLSTEQRAQAAETFGAEGQFISAGKKLLDTRDEKFAAVGAARRQIQSYWKSLSLPYPEPGLRLIKQADIEDFDAQMRQYQAELAGAVEQLDAHFASLKSAARERLGSLYNEADYPGTLGGLFTVEWDFPSVEPPEYLARLNPALFEQEKQRITRRFDEAVQLAEQAFTAELSKLVEHLVERLGSEADGSKKTFRDTAVTNLSEFFERFKALNVHSNADLDKLVQTAQRAIHGVEPQAVRDSDGLRQQLSAQLSTVAASLDQMLVDQPRRRILRPAAKEES